MTPVYLSEVYMRERAEIAATRIDLALKHQHLATSSYIAGDALSFECHWFSHEFHGGMLRIALLLTLNHFHILSRV